MLLELKDITVHYGRAVAIALDHVSLHMEEGEVVSIIGANGAGKTTIVRSIIGLKKPSSGEIWFKNRRIDSMQTHEIIKMGLALVPSERWIFAPMTVLDNLRLGASRRRDRNEVSKDLEDIYTLFPILKERKNQLAGQLSGGQQQMLAVARALIAKPDLLIMDEPSTGLSPLLVIEMANIVRELNKKGLTILLVEQNCRMALKISKRAYIIEVGKVQMQGNSNELFNDENVKRCYLGTACYINAE